MTERNEETPPHSLDTVLGLLPPAGLTRHQLGKRQPRGPPLRIPPRRWSVGWTMCSRTLHSPPPAGDTVAGSNLVAPKSRAHRESHVFDGPLCSLSL